MTLRELRPNEGPRLESELFLILQEMLSQDPDALNRILATLNRALEPVLDRQSALN